MKAAITFRIIMKVAVIIINNQMEHPFKIVIIDGNPQIFINNIQMMIFQLKKMKN